MRTNQYGCRDNDYTKSIGAEFLTLNRKLWVVSGLLFMSLLAAQLWWSQSCFSVCLSSATIFKSINWKYTTQDDDQTSGIHPRANVHHFRLGEFSKITLNVKRYWATAKRFNSTGTQVVWTLLSHSWSAVLAGNKEPYSVSLDTRDFELLPAW